MTVPQADAPQAFSSTQMSKLSKSEAVDNSGADSRAKKELLSNLQQDPSQAKSSTQQLSRTGGKECKPQFRAAHNKPRPGKRGNGVAGKVQGDHTAPASTEMAGASPNSSFTPGIVGYYPYGHQMYYYVPVPGYGGKPGRPETAATASSTMPSGMLSYPYSSYNSAVRLSSNGIPPTSRRPANHGWGGVPLGSHAAAPGHAFSTSHRSPVTFNSGLGPTMFRGGQRSMGAARTMPLPPKKTTSTDSSAAPASPAQVDYPTRTSTLATSSFSSGSSTDGEVGTRRAGSAASSSTEGAVLPGAVGEGEGEDAAAGVLSGCEGSCEEEEKGRAGLGPPSAEQQQQGGDGGKGSCQGMQQQQQTAGEGGGGADRQPCAFFLKTGTCAYGDRCKFEHPYEQAPLVEFNSLGLPLRPSEPECSYYMKYRTCGFGHTCKFHHPEVDEVELAARSGPPPAAYALQYMQYTAHPMGVPPYTSPFPGAAMQAHANPSGYPPQHMAMGSVMMYPSQPRPPAQLPYMHAMHPPSATTAAAAVAAKQAAAAGKSSEGADEPVVPGSPVAAARAAEAVPTAVPVSVALPRVVVHQEGLVQQAQQAVSPPRPLMVFGKSRDAEEVQG